MRIFPTIIKKIINIVTGGGGGGGATPSYDILSESCQERHGIFIGTSRPAVVASPWAGFGNALDFPGVNQGADTPGISCGAISFGGVNPFTIEARIRCDGTTAHGGEHIAGVWRTGGGSPGETLFKLELNSFDLRATLTVAKEGGGAVTAQTSSGCLPGELHVLAGVFDGTNLKVFLDGVLGSTVALNGFALAGDATSLFTIGRGIPGTDVGAGATPFNGLIDEVRVSNIARYSGNYTPAAAPFTCDEFTVGSWQLDGVTTITGPPSVSANFLALVRTGIRALVNMVLRVPVKTGIRASTTGILRVPVKPAIRITPLVSGTILPATKPALRLSTPGVLRVPSDIGFALSVAPSTLKVPKRPAFNITHPISMTGFNYVQPATAVQDAGGNWATIANSEGAPDASYATLTEGLVLVTGTLRGSFAAQPNRPASLAITQVFLDFFFETSGFPVLGTIWSVGWRNGGLGGLEVTLQGPESSNVNFLSTPLTFDITAGFGGVGEPTLTWPSLAAVQPFYTGSILVDTVLNPVFRVTATRLRYVASETWNP